MHQAVQIAASRVRARLLFLTVFAVLLTTTFPVWAQEAPDEFVFIRAALREKFGLRLMPGTLVDVGWEQIDFTDGIESCIDEGERTGRSAPWGREYFVEPGNGVIYRARISFDQGIVIACDSAEHDALVAGQAAAAAAAVAPPAEVPPDAAPPETMAGSAVVEVAAAAPPPPPPPVAAGSAARGGFALGGHVQNMSASTFGIMQRAGMTWVKKQVRYSLGDSPGNVADLINVAHGNGYQILLGIVGRADQMGDYPAYISAYSQYVAGVAALGADAIEVWNEPNIDREWPAASINGGTYAASGERLQRDQSRQRQYHRHQRRARADRLFWRGGLWRGRLQ